MKKTISLTIILLGLNFISAQDCVDDATGAFTGMGMSCAQVLGFGTACDAIFAGTLVSGECPVSCNACPADCEADGPTSHGCCLPDNNLYINEDGLVFYNATSVCIYCEDSDYNNNNLPWEQQQTSCVVIGNSTFTINTDLTAEECMAIPSYAETGGWWLDGALGGFQFVVNGATLNGDAAASGGDAGSAAFTMSTNPESGMALGFSLTGATFGPSCGTMVELDIDGIPTGLSDLVISNGTGTLIPFSYYSESVLGCTNVAACNYNADATEDNGSCTYAEENYDCDGNCNAGTDCTGYCGGSAEVDSCGVCSGGNSGHEANSDQDDCGVCFGDNSDMDVCGICNGSGDTCETPLDFIVNQSANMAFYYFHSVTINGVAVEPDDWVGAFNGDICVGARQWDTSVCNNNVCDIIVMGDDGTGATDGYMISGDLPTFKIYDASENAYYDAVASEDIPWYNFGLYIVDVLNVSSGVILGCMDGDACNYNANATDDDDSCVYSCIGCMDDEACNYDSDFTVECGDCCEFPEENYDCNGNCIAMDCAGVCGGDAEIDECGICGGDNAVCTDCNGVINGDAVYDNCGYLCIENTPSDDCSVYCDNDISNDCVQDCEGTWGGTVEFDECGECGGDGSSCDSSSSVDYSIQMNIENLNLDAGTFDIYMTNIPSCSYCLDPTYNNTYLSWPQQREACEREDQGNSTWIVDTAMTEAECENVPSLAETGGWWFDGYVGGMNFFVIGAEITSISGGTAGATFNLLALNSNADCTADGIIDEGCNFIVATSMSGQTIAPQIDELLLTIEFVNFNGSAICFTGMDTPPTGNWSPPAISDANGELVMVDWGGCAANSNDCPSGIYDCLGVCDGGTQVDVCGVCGGDNSSCVDCTETLYGDAYLDDCGVCSGGTSGHEGNSDMDVCGVCGGDGSACEFDCDSPVCMNIANVNIDTDSSGFLDIYMINQAGCSYCDDPSYYDQLMCEVSGNNGVGGTWLFDTSIDAQTCSGVCTNSLGDVSQYQNFYICTQVLGQVDRGLCSNSNYVTQSICEEHGGTWEDNAWTPSAMNGTYSSGLVGGFQFQLFGMTVTGASGGSAEDSNWSVETSDDNYNEETQTPSPNVLGFTLSGNPIPPGQGVLTQISFTDFQQEGICFAHEINANCLDFGNAICDENAECVSATDWGDCYCYGDLVEDCAGECGGSSEVDCAGTCGGDLEPDCFGVCGGSAVVDGCGVCGGNSECLMEHPEEIFGAWWWISWGEYQGTTTDCSDEPYIYMESTVGDTSTNATIYNSDGTGAFGPGFDFTWHVIGNEISTTFNIPSPFRSPMGLYSSCNIASTAKIISITLMTPSPFRSPSIPVSTQVPPPQSSVQNHSP